MSNYHEGDKVLEWILEEDEKADSKADADDTTRSHEVGTDISNSKLGKLMKFLGGAVGSKKSSSERDALVSIHSFSPPPLPSLENIDLTSSSSAGQGTKLKAAAPVSGEESDKYFISAATKKKTASIVSATSSAASSGITTKKKAATKKLPGSVLDSAGMGEQAPLLGGHSSSKLEYTELSAGLAQRDGEEGSIVMMAWYSYWNPLENIYGIFVNTPTNKRTNSTQTELSSMRLRCVDFLRLCALLWLLTVNMRLIVGSMITGFTAWLDTQQGLLKLISADDECFHPLTVALVLQGYVMSAYMLNLPVEHRTTSLHSQQLLHYHRWNTVLRRIQDYFYLSWWAVFPSLIAVVLFALVYGATSASDVVKCACYDSCSRYWWTNLLFVTNFTPFFTTNTASNICGSSGNFGDGIVCFPSLWALSCGAQVTLAFVPVLVIHTLNTSYGCVATALWTVVSLVVRFLVCQRLQNESDFAMYVEYAPWCRAEAVGFGAAIYMYQSIAQARDAAHAAPQAPTEQSSVAHGGVSTPARGLPDSSRYSSPYDSPRKMLRFSGGTSFMSPYSPLPSERNALSSLSPFRMYFSGGNLGSTVGTPSRESCSPASPNFIGMIEDGRADGPKGALAAYPLGAPDDQSCGSTMLSITIKLIELGVAAGIFSFCLLVTVTDEPDWFAQRADSPWQYRNVRMLCVAIMTSMAMLVLMDGTILWPLSTLVTSLFIYPLASLSYTAFLMQALVVYLFCQSLGPDSSFSWSGSLQNYSIIYCELLLASIVLAFFLSILIEKPLYRLALDRHPS